MPLPLAAAIAAGTSILNTGAQMLTNSQNRKRALEDWNRQNAYNSPQQQMQRFKEAGLNPNLIYKQTNEAAPVRSTDYVAPQLPDFQGILSKSNQIKLQDQQFKNMQLQNDAIEAQIMKTKADSLYIASNTNYRNLDAERLKGQLPGLVDSVQLKNLQTIVDTDKSRAQIDNLIADTKNKVQQLPILESTKQKIDAEVQRLITSNKFIALEKNTQLAIQKIMMSNMKILGDNMLRQGVSEGLKQELIISQTKKVLEEISKLRTSGVENFGFDEVMDIFKLLK